MAIVKIYFFSVTLVTQTACSSLIICPDLPLLTPTIEKCIEDKEYYFLGVFKGSTRCVQNRLLK